MLTKILIKKFGYNKPIFTKEILETLNEYSNQRVYQLIEESIKEGKLVRYDTGINYVPTKTEFGQPVITVNDIIEKKYISENENVFGIYGKYIIELNFMLSYQVPNKIEVITNNESRDVREIEIRGRKVVLRKSRLPITKENASAYTLLELFNIIDMKQYFEEKQIKENIKKYINEEKIKYNDIFSMASYFPAKTMKNLVASGVLYDFT